LNVPEFDLPFACKLADLANHAMDEDQFKYANRRAAVYLSRVACEIAAKALLEAAGMPVKDIVRRRHDIPALLRDLGRCEVNVNLSGEPDWISANVVAERFVDLGLARIPILDLIGVSDDAYSKFPNETRYGEVVTDAHPSLLATAAATFCDWADQFHRRIRLSQVAE
jgi:HEPN domain-containing protein